MSARQVVTVEEILSRRQYDRSYSPPPEDVVLTIENQNIGSKGNFIVLSGLPKAGKTTFLASIIASAFTHYDIFTMKLKLNGNLGYFDTESSTNDFYNNIRRIRQFAGWIELPNSFQAFNTRIDPFEMQRALIEKYIELYKPELLIVDGLLDLVRNYNDESESRALMDWLKALTQVHNLLVIGCIHLGKKDNHTLGHFGSMCDRYAQSVLEIVRDYDNNLFMLKAKMLRSAPTFSTIALQQVGGYFTQVPAPIEKKLKK